jgi:O-antigen/teichoic acid export membrane protein
MTRFLDTETFGMFGALMSISTLTGVIGMGISLYLTQKITQLQRGKQMNMIIMIWKRLLWI